jgi:hypothetical protein
LQIVFNEESVVQRKKSRFAYLKQNCAFCHFSNQASRGKPAWVLAIGVIGMVVAKGSARQQRPHESES